MGKKRSSREFQGSAYEFSPMTEDEGRALRGDIAPYGRHKIKEFKRTLEYLDKLDADGVKKIDALTTIRIDAANKHTDVYSELRKKELIRKKEAEVKRSLLKKHKVSKKSKKPKTQKPTYASVSNKLIKKKDCNKYLYYKSEFHAEAAVAEAKYHHNKYLESVFCGKHWHVRLIKNKQLI